MLWSLVEGQHVVKMSVGADEESEFPNEEEFAVSDSDDEVEMGNRRENSFEETETPESFSQEEKSDSDVDGR